MKKIIAAALMSAAAVLVIPAPSASALPGQCMGSPWGGFCDTDPWTDGSFMHGVNVMGFWSYTRSCHGGDGQAFPTDYDPRTPC